MFWITAAALMSAFVPSAGATSPDSPGLVVHEWGTFTTFSGADGVAREFEAGIGQELPEFVYSRPRQAGKMDDHEIQAIKYSRAALVRMETPVTYFYTSTARTVDVDVRMPEGALTEFYPPVRHMQPEYRGLNSEVTAGGRLTWLKLNLIPASTSTESIKLPPTKPGDHYGAARETDSAYVQFEGVGGTHFEKFLFYRGLGKFDPPITVKALGDDRFKMMNKAKDATPAAFVLQVDAGKLRYAKYGECTSELELQLPTAPASLDSLSAAMEGVLVKCGLYDKEAAAMVKTWRDSWFSEQGTRVLYILPQGVTDQILPLTVTPSPEKQQRVFVGRVEILTPEVQGRIEALVGGVAGRDQVNQAWTDATIKRLGRFAGPALEYVATAPLKAQAAAGAKRMLGK